MINLKDIPPFKNASMGFEFQAHRMYEGFDANTLDCGWELTGEFRFVDKNDEGYLSWDEAGFLVVIPGGVRPVSRIRAPRLILRRKPQPQPAARSPRMAVTEIDVYGPSIPPIPEGWEDNGFCIIQEELHEAYLDLNGEARDTKKYALVGMVRIALKRKPQPPAPLIGPDTRLGACFRSGGLNPGDPPKYYKVISKSSTGQRNYLVVEQMGAVMESEFTQNWGINTLFLADKYINSLPYLSPVPDHIFRDQVLHIVMG